MDEDLGVVEARELVAFIRGYLVEKKPQPEVIIAALVGLASHIGYQAFDEETTDYMITRTVAEVKKCYYKVEL